MTPIRYHRILLKISGEMLAGSQSYGIHPEVLTNLAEEPAHQGTRLTLSAKADARWDLAAFDADVRKSQARRWVVYEALRKGGYYPWDHQPLRNASEQYMRNHMDLNVLEENKRFPRGE